MTNTELITEARKLLEDYPNYQEYAGGPLLKYPHQDALKRVTHALEAAEARVKELEAERDAALARIAEAWALHEPFTWSFGFGPVQSCKWCAENGVPQEIASWPCATIRALEERGVGDGVHEI